MSYFYDYSGLAERAVSALTAAAKSSEAAADMAIATSELFSLDEDWCNQHNGSEVIRHIAFAEHAAAAFIAKHLDPKAIATSLDVLNENVYDHSKLTEAERKRRSDAESVFWSIRHAMKGAAKILENAVREANAAKTLLITEANDFLQQINKNKKDKDLLRERQTNADQNHQIARTEAIAKARRERRNEEDVADDFDEQARSESDKVDLDNWFYDTEIESAEKCAKCAQLGIKNIYYITDITQYIFTIILEVSN